jgi:hypothetical protein
MSGRARHWRDGELITNRKTDRRSPRTGGQDFPPWRVTLPLPGAFAWSLSSDHPSGVIGVAISKASTGALQAEGSHRDLPWLFGQLATFFSGLAKLGGWQGRVHLRIQRDAYPGLTSGAPLQPAIDREAEAILITEPSFVIMRGHKDPLIIPVKS